VRVLDASLIKTPWARRVSVGVYDSPIYVVVTTVLFNTYKVVFVILRKRPHTGWGIMLLLLLALFHENRQQSPVFDSANKKAG
jgi:hypothetical protein